MNTGRHIERIYTQRYFYINIHKLYIIGTTNVVAVKYSSLAIDSYLIAHL